ncbi:hypothetical protein [Rhodoferax sp.]|uniref:hypothetical protein n=1 Tax=Rhodoferax sp. TaxID=50421 RepID=UPI00374DB3AE
MKLSIDYQLVGAGWSRCKVTSEELECELSASYLSDALATLVLGACSVLAGFASVSFGFDEEPGEYRWSVNRVTPTEIKIRLLKFSELWSNLPDSEGQLLVEFSCHPLEFGLAVQSAAASVLAEHGLVTYKEKWVQHEFPSKQLEVLNEYVARWQSWQT